MKVVDRPLVNRLLLAIDPISASTDVHTSRDGTSCVGVLALARTTGALRSDAFHQMASKPYLLKAHLYNHSSQRIHSIWSSYANAINISIWFGLKTVEINKRVTSKAYYFRLTLSNRESIFFSELKVAFLIFTFF